MHRRGVVRAWWKLVFQGRLTHTQAPCIAILANLQTTKTVSFTGSGIYGLALSGCDPPCDVVNHFTCNVAGLFVFSRRTFAFARDKQMVQVGVEFESDI